MNKEVFRNDCVLIMCGFSARHFTGQLKWPNFKSCINIKVFNYLVPLFFSVLEIELSYLCSIFDRINRAAKAKLRPNNKVLSSCVSRVRAPSGRLLMNVPNECSQTWITPDHKHSCSSSSLTGSESKLRP